MPNFDCLLKTRKALMQKLIDFYTSFINQILVEHQKKNFLNTINTLAK